MEEFSRTATSIATIGRREDSPARQCKLRPRLHSTAQRLATREVETTRAASASAPWRIGQRLVHKAPATGRSIKGIGIQAATPITAGTRRASCSSAKPRTLGPWPTRCGHLPASARGRHKFEHHPSSSVKPEWNRLFNRQEAEVGPRKGEENAILEVPFSLRSEPRPSSSTIVSVSLLTHSVALLPSPGKPRLQPSLSFKTKEFLGLCARSIN